MNYFDTFCHGRRTRQAKLNAVIKLGREVAETRRQASCLSLYKLFMSQKKKEVLHPHRDIGRTASFQITV